MPSEDCPGCWGLRYQKLKPLRLDSASTTAISHDVLHCVRSGAHLENLSVGFLPVVGQLLDFIAIPRKPNFGELIGLAVEIGLYLHNQAQGGDGHTRFEI